VTAPRYFDALEEFSKRYFAARPKERDALLKEHKTFGERLLREYGFVGADELEAWFSERSGKRTVDELDAELRARRQEQGDDAGIAANLQPALTSAAWLDDERGRWGGLLGQSLTAGLVPVVLVREVLDADEDALRKRPPVVVSWRPLSESDRFPHKGNIDASHLFARALGHGGDCGADDMPGEIRAAFVALVEAIDSGGPEGESVRAAYHAFAPAFWAWFEQRSPTPVDAPTYLARQWAPSLFLLLGGDPAETTFALFSDDGSEDTHWLRDPGHPPRYKRGDSSTVVSVGGLPNQEIAIRREEYLWTKIVRGLMNDETRKTFAFVMARCLAVGTEIEVRFHVNDLLAFRAAKKHHSRDYRPEHKREERERLWALTQFYLQVDDRVDERLRNGKTRKKNVRLTSQLITVGFESELTLPLENTPEDVPYAFRIRLGSWAKPYVANLPRYLAPLFAKVGQYDPTNAVQRIALRLALFLSFKWGEDRLTLEMSVASLLRTATIPLPKNNPLRFRESFEAALDRLRDDGVIYGWQYAEHVDESTLGRKWFKGEDGWLAWPVKIEAPSEVADFYLHTPAAVAIDAGD
jgi:hypothetical protein